LQPFAKPVGSDTGEKGKPPALVDENQNRIGEKALPRRLDSDVGVSYVRNLDILTTAFTIAPKILLSLSNFISI
jgi:hypothetical protein